MVRISPGDQTPGYRTRSIYDDARQSNLKRRRPDPDPTTLKTRPKKKRPEGRLVLGGLNNVNRQRFQRTHILRLRMHHER